MSGSVLFWGQYCSACLSNLLNSFISIMTKTTTIMQNLILTGVLVIIIFYSSTKL